VDPERPDAVLLASPATTSADADRHTEVFGEAIAQLLS
jgi:hypothetical protein